MLRLDEKLARIRSGGYRKGDFIIADAKDGDMGPSIKSCGPHRNADGSAGAFRTRPEFLDSIEAIVTQDVVDVMLTSVSNLEALQERRVYDTSRVTPAIRANDTTDVWVFRGASYAKQPSRPFRTANLGEARRLGCDLGLYSITFNNDLDADYMSLEHFAAFREDAAANDFRYFLEVFNPNVDCGIGAEDIPGYVNDAMMRCMAGLSKRERPEFLKIAYNGPRALDELVSYDPSVTVGVLGGGAGTTRDCLELIAQIERYGARVALFGRKINLADDPQEMVRMMRAVADGEMGSEEATRAYHGVLQSRGITPSRPLEDDVQITEAVLAKDALKSAA
ncbi:hypothetical protein [Salipiger mangrovisoli]|uniref:Fructose-bisphosphate aldolase class Ia, DhnA family n=1 Tax=Salipiger mangrovisoli TaxID=2865933 RepID=A0ABR9X4T4_9RHOB|nr:hypothetical protein [Salipiger mangrovisoli]MBE9638610.1 hypothetical protein [Salipiger mangrovisoli]